MRALEFLAEAFDQPYPLDGWKETEYGDVDASAQLPDGGHLLIMFNTEQNDDGEETVIIRFDRNGSEEITGAGDAQRIFATVLSAIQEYLKDYQPLRVIFSASKNVDVGQNVDSRFKLYDRMILRYAKSWGYRFFRADKGEAVIYELSRLRPVAENFADGKKPGRKGLAKRVGVNCKQPISKLRSIASHSTGERQRMAHWCANMKSGKQK